MEYVELTETQQRLLLREKLARLEQQHFEATVNAAMASSAGDVRVEEFEQKASDVESGIGAVKGLLAVLPAAPADEALPVRVSIVSPR